MAKDRKKKCLKKKLKISCDNIKKIDTADRINSIFFSFFMNLNFFSHSDYINAIQNIQIEKKFFVFFPT